MGLSTFGTIPVPVWRMSFQCVCPWQCLLMHLLCCFSFVSCISSLMNLSRSTICPCGWNFVEEWVVSVDLRATWNWLWLSQSNWLPLLSLVTPTALQHQSPEAYTQRASKCGLATNLVFSEQLWLFSQKSRNLFLLHNLYFSGFRCHFSLLYAHNF